MKSFFGTFAGVKTHYEIWGSGEKPMVILHGWGGSTESFYCLAELLEKTGNYTIYLMDVPGFGESDMPPITGWGSPEYAGWLQNFLNEKELSDAVLVGHSNGGRMILRDLLGRKHNHPIVLIGSAGVKWPATGKLRLVKVLKKCFGWIQYLLPIKLYNIIRRKVFKAHDWVAVDPELKPSLAKILAETDMRPLLESKKIENEFLLLWGANDTYTPLKSGKELDRILKHTKLVVYDNGRHAIHRTHTAAIATEIDQFIMKKTS